MNKEFSELNKQMQAQIKKEITYQEGIKTLIDLRTKLYNELLLLKKTLEVDDFSAIPFINSKGYDSKTIAYSLWHIFRIEDIVVHSLIIGDEQIFFSGSYQKKIKAPIITTGNELVKEEIAEFSKQLDMNMLYEYTKAVKEKTDEFLKELTYSELKRKITDKEKTHVQSLNVVSEDANAEWLIDYWCNKDIKGLIQMPLSRHWIMHVEASLRIAEKLHNN